MKKLRFPRVTYGYRVFFTASLALLLAQPLFAESPGKASGSRKNAAKTPPSAPSGTAPATPKRDAHDFADAFPSAPHPVAPDLLLKKDDENKADALAAFSQGLVAEDNADQEKMIEAYKKALAAAPNRRLSVLGLKAATSS